MKFHVIAALAVLFGVTAAESMSTVLCSGCPPHSFAPDMVTRSAQPTSSCTDRALTVVSDETAPGSSGAAMPTGSKPSSTPTAVVPVNGAAGNSIGSLGGPLIIAAAAIGYMM